MSESLDEQEVFDGEFNVRMLRYMGFLHDRIPAGWRRFLYNVYGLINGILTINLAYTSLPLALQGGEFAQVAELVGVVISAGFVSFKGWWFFTHGSKLAWLAPHVARGLAPTASRTPRQAALLRAANRRLALLNRNYLILEGVTLFVWFVIPFGLRTVSDHKIFPVQGVHYMDVTTFPGYDIELATIAVCATVAMSVLVTADCFVCACLLLATTELRLLNLSLMSLCERAHHAVGRENATVFIEAIEVTEGGVSDGNVNFEISGTFKDEERGRGSQDMLRIDEAVDCEMEKLLNQCVEHHNLIFTYMERMQDAIGYMMMGQFLNNTLIICVIAFQVSMLLNDILYVIKILCQMAIMLAELYVFCSYAEEVTQEADAVSLACYSCGWYAAGPRFRSSLVIMMTRARRQLAFKAGPIYVASLETFVTLINGSYSLFTLLMSVNDK